MPKLISTIVRRASLTITCLSFFITLIAQKRLVDVQRTTSVDAITKEKLVELKYSNMTDLLRLSPETNHVNSRTITYNFNTNSIDKRTDVIYYDAKNNPSYMLSTTTNSSGIPIEAIEEIRINKDLESGYSWGNTGTKQWTEKYDNSKNKYVPIDFMTTWKPQLSYVPPAPSSIEVADHSKWTAELTEERTKPDGTITVDDKTYSSTGKSEIKYSKDGNVKIREEKIYDARGVVREYVYRELYPDDYVYEETTYYNCHGQPIYFESTWYDDEDYEIEMVDLVFKNGQAVAGIRDVDDFDPEMGPMEFRQFLNPQSMKFEYLLSPEWEYEDYFFDMDDSNDPCDYPDHLITIGPRIILEDSYPERFSTYGGFVNYTYLLNQHWGISADLGLTKGSQFDDDYTKLNIMVGPTWYPCTKMNLDDPFSFSAHIFAGYSNITSKYTFNSMTSKSSDGSFSAMGGLDGYYNFNSKMALRLSANYNINSADGNTSNNYLFDVGLSFKLK